MTGRAYFESVTALSQERAREREPAKILEQHDLAVLPTPDWVVHSPSAATMAMERVLAKKKRAAPSLIPWRSDTEERANETLLQQPKQVERGRSGQPGKSGYAVHDPYDDSSMETFDLQYVELITEETPEALSKTDLAGEAFTVRLTFPPKQVVEQVAALTRSPAALVSSFVQSVEGADQIKELSEPAAALNMMAMAQPAVAESLPMAKPAVALEPVAERRPPPAADPSAESAALVVSRERSVATEIERELLASMLESAQVARESARMVRESAVLAAESALAMCRAMPAPNAEPAVNSIQVALSPAVVKPERVIVPVEKLFTGLSNAWGDVLDSVVGRRSPKKW